MLFLQTTMSPKGDFRSFCQVKLIFGYKVEIEKTPNNYEK